MATADAVLAAAAKDLGYIEGKTTKFGEWYVQVTGARGQGFEGGAWCDMAVSRWADQAGAAAAVGRFAYVPYHMNWFKQQGIWHAGAGGIRRGDVIVFEWNRDATPDHIGYVEFVDAGGIHTIEGNTGSPEGVRRVVRQAGVVMGYGRPRYDGAVTMLSRGSAGPDVAALQRRLNTWGANPKLDADGDFGPTTEKAVRAFQAGHKLEVDGVAGPATLAKLAAPPAPSGSAAPGPYTGEYVTGGVFSLAKLAGKLGYPANTLLRMTACHYGTLGNELGQHVADVLTGKIPPATPVPKGVKVWCG